MSYAQAAGAGTESQEKYYNGNLLICYAGSFSYDELTQALNREGYRKHVQVFQTVDYYRRFAVQFDNTAVRDRLLENGINVAGNWVYFSPHQKGIYIRPRWKVYVSQLPSGITHQEIRAVLQNYGNVRDVHVITRSLFGRRYDTGDRVVIFSALDKDIPSYLSIKGWKAFIRYSGQPKTCRICERTGHIVKDCPVNQRSTSEEDQQDTQPDAEDMETHSSESNTENHPDAPGVLDGLIPESHSTLDEVSSVPNVQKEESHVFANAALQTAEEPNVLGNITIEDCIESSEVENVSEEERKITIQVKTWADRSAPEEQGITKIKVKSGFKPYCPRCKVDSHSEEEWWNAVCKSSNKRKLPIGDSKPGKGVTKSKKGRTIKRFKQDLEKVVCKGRVTDELRYVMEYDNRNEVYACFLLSNYGDFSEFHSVAGLAMANNPEVMDLWARYSGEGKLKNAADSQLRWYNDQI